MAMEEWRTMRNDLYLRLWDTPIKALAVELDIPYNDIIRLSDEYEIPRPPMGHWMKVQHRKSVTMPELKPLPGKEEIILERYARATRPYDEEQKQTADRRIADEKLAEKRIVVSTELMERHPYVTRAEKSLRNAAVNERQLLVPRAQKCLDIRVSRDALTRALCITDALLKAFQERDIAIKLTGETEYPTRVEVLGETFAIGLEEKVDRREKEPTLEEKRERAKHPWMYGRPDYTYHPNGQLVLSIKDAPSRLGRRNWSDGKRQRVEALLSKFICALFESAVLSRSDRLQWKIDEERRIEEQRRREEVRQLQEAERARLERLDKDVDRWKRSQLIREYVAAVRQSAQGQESMYGDLPISDWIVWALQQADRIDPLQISPYSVLDEKVSTWW